MPVGTMKTEYTEQNTHKIRIHKHNNKNKTIHLSHLPQLPQAISSSDNTSECKVFAISFLSA